MDSAHRKVVHKRSNEATEDKDEKNSRLQKLPTIRCVRETGVSRDSGHPLKPTGPSQSTVILRGLRGTRNGDP